MGYIVSGAFLLKATKEASHEKVWVAKCCIVAITALLFVLLLSNDHVFGDSTIPGIVEDHMTMVAQQRHANRLRYDDYQKFKDSMNESGGK